MDMMRKFGIHPLVAVGLVAVDTMLFGADVTGVGWIISCLVATVLMIPAILIQHFSYKDKWGIAIAKGIGVGVLTAIPTPLPAVITGSGGIMGLIGMLKPNNWSKDEMPRNKDNVSATEGIN
jgi:hypothetical protein